MDDYTSGKTTAVRPLLNLGRRRVLVHVRVLPGTLGQDELPSGYALPNGEIIKASRWQGTRLTSLGFGLALAAATAR